ncbi:MAG: NAD(P)/FAD-dependent oxidoreductase [Chloroflexi bacterium]|nr:NAD(P)/FAD-dependent oxidoreductase [Chloroflexota bacterium]
MKRHVIIGNGGAAFNALQAIRSLLTDDDIAVVSREACPAYSPMLTPYYVAGRIPYSGMFLCRPGFYRKYGAKALLGRSAVAVEPGRQRVHLDDGHTLDYDELLIASGSSPNVPSVPGADLGLTLWTLYDARRLRAAVRRSGSVAVVGAGLIGLQVVDTLLQLNKKVMLIEIKERLLPRVLDGEGAAIVSERLLGRGVMLHLGAQARKITVEKGKKLVHLDSGATIEAGTVVFATGVRPNTAFLGGTGLKVDSGIEVDEVGRTSIEHIFAAGDVARSIDPASGRSGINATWTNAVHGGWAAGCNMAGKRLLPRQSSRVNVLSPAGLPVVSLGLVEPENGRDEVVVHRSHDSYRRLVFRGDRLVGAVLIGEVGEAGILGHAMENGEMPPSLKADLAINSAFHKLARSVSVHGMSGQHPALIPGGRIHR